MSITHKRALPGTCGGMGTVDRSPKRVKVTSTVSYSASFWSTVLETPEIDDTLAVRHCREPSGRSQVESSPPSHAREDGLPDGKVSMAMECFARPRAARNGRFGTMTRFGFRDATPIPRLQDTQYPEPYSRGTRTADQCDVSSFDEIARSIETDEEASDLTDGVELPTAYHEELLRPSVSVEDDDTPFFDWDPYTAASSLCTTPSPASSPLGYYDFMAPIIDYKFQSPDAAVESWPTPWTMTSELAADDELTLSHFSGRLESPIYVSPQYMVRSASDQPDQSSVDGDYLAPSACTTYPRSVDSATDLTTEAMRLATQLLECERCTMECQKRRQMVLQTVSKLEDLRVILKEMAAHAPLDPQC